MTTSDKNPAKANSELYFIYGTLKRGGSNEDLLRRSEYIKHIRISDFSLFQNQWQQYPKMVRTDGGAVVGELWRVGNKEASAIHQMETSYGYKKEVVGNLTGEKVYSYVYLYRVDVTPTERPTAHEFNVATNKTLVVGFRA